MARKINNTIYRVNAYGVASPIFVECKDLPDLYGYVAKLLNEGKVVTSVNEICADGSTPRVAVLSNKEFKKVLRAHTPCEGCDTEEKLTISLDDTRELVAAKSMDPDYPELYIDIREKGTGVYLQDICAARPSYSVKNGQIRANKGFIDCLVWEESDYEDYTKKAIIEMRENNKDE